MPAIPRQNMYYSISHCARRRRSSVGDGHSARELSGCDKGYLVMASIARELQPFTTMVEILAKPFDNPLI